MDGKVIAGDGMKSVKVLIVEDNEEKALSIRSEISNFFGTGAEFVLSTTFGDGTQKILQEKFDLIVVDLLLPRRAGNEPTDVSEEMIDHISNSELNNLTTVVAISQFDDLVSQQQNVFTRAGIFLIKYSEEASWKSCLRICMQKVSFKRLYDFVIVCAIELERSAFEGVTRPNFEYGELLTVQGLDVREIKIGNLNGVCVLQPQMGLVDAGIIATRALNAFCPKLLCMSGICGGIAGEVEIGTLLVSDLSWDYQAGKWRGDDFELRAYQQPLENETRTKLNQMALQDPKLSSLASKGHEIKVPQVGIEVRPTVSGSAVIASSKYSDDIKRQHGKIAGIDMEVYGIYRAAALHGGNVICFAAKTVVDHADESKNDDIQQAGAILAARFVVNAIEALI